MSVLSLNVFLGIWVHLASHLMLITKTNIVGHLFVKFDVISDILTCHWSHKSIGKSTRSDRDERVARVTILAQWTLIKSAPCSDLIQPLSDVMDMFNEVRGRARCIFCSDSDGEERCWDKNSIWSWHYVPHTRCSPPGVSVCHLMRSDW